MISFHLGSPDASQAWAFARDFKEARIDDVERLSRGIARYVWSPCIWKDGVRRQDNFLEAQWCVLDFDSGELSLREAENIFCDMVHIIGTTKSHQISKGDAPAVDRFRVALKFEHSVRDLRQYRFAMSQVTRRYPADPSPKDGARYFFPCKEIVSLSGEGYTEDVPSPPAWFERPDTERFERYRRAGVMPPRARFVLSNVVAVGERNTTWYGIAKDLTRMGLSTNDIAARIVDSPTYSGKVSRELLLEIETCVANGRKAALREDMLSGRRQREEEPAGERDQASRQTQKKGPIA